MAVNPYVDLHDAANEQTLIDNLVVESIKFYGNDMYYLPRTGEYDSVFREQEQSEFNSAFEIEMYIKTVDGYGGDGQFLSNFGIEVRHQAVFSVSMSRWKVEATNDGQPQNIIDRPREGDLIFYKKDRKILEVKRVNKYEMFYQIGALQTWELTCEVFEFGSEKFNTGVEEIDNIASKLSLSTREQGTIGPDGPEFDPDFDIDGLDTDEFADNTDIDDTANPLIDFSENNPFSETF